MDHQQLCWTALLEFKKRVLDQLLDQVDAMVVYGSVARGEATADSDTDVLIIGANIHQHLDNILQIGADVDLEYGTLTAFILRTPEQLKRSLQEENPLMHLVIHDGVVLHDSGVYESIHSSIPAKSFTVVG